MTDLLKTNTNKALVSMSLPVSIGMLSTFLFQIIDTYFVGQLGPDALAALSFSSTIYFIIVGLFIGLAVGISIVVGQLLGASDRQNALKAIRIGVLQSFLLSGLISWAVLTFLDPIFLALGAPLELLEPIRAYMVPLLLGTPLLTTGLMMGSALRSSGIVKAPEILMAIAGIINLVGDYGLIFGNWGLPEMGIRGAAVASFSSWVFIILGMIVLMLRAKLLSLFSSSSQSFGQLFKEINKISAPTVLTQVIGPATLMYLTFLLAQESPLAVAAFGVAGRIETLLMIGILGVSTAMTPFIAQNLGAKQDSRIDEAIAFGGRASTYLGLIVAVILFLFIRPVANLFSDDPEIIGSTANYFYFVSGSYIFYGLYLVTTSIFNGLKLTINSLRISLIKAIVFTVPLTFVGSFWGVNGIFAGLAVSNVFAGLYAAYEMRKDLKKYNSPLAEVNVLDEYKKDLLRIFGVRSK